MKIFSFQKTDREKIFSFCGWKWRIERKWYRKERRLYAGLSAHPSLREDGFSLVGNFSKINGEMQVARDFAKALAKADIPFECLELDGSSGSPHFRKKITFTTDWHAKDPRFWNISVLVWEFTDGMPEYRPYLFKEEQEVLTFSAFNVKYFQSIMPSSIVLRRIPYPVDFDEIPDEDAASVRTRYGLEPEDFVCFFNFDYSSSYFRKNPEGLLEAFRLAFAEEPRSKLFLKTVGNNEALRGRMKTKIQQAGLQSRVLFCNEKLPHTSILSLIQAADCYVSLHRGEGNGLGMMEAMRLGKPVLGTSFGGNTDFVREDVAFPLGFKMVKPAEVDIDAYRHVSEWPEPDVRQAAEILRRLFKDRELGLRIGQKAAAFIRDFYNHERFRKAVQEMLEDNVPLRSPSDGPQSV